MRITVGPYNKMLQDITPLWKCGSTDNHLSGSKIHSFTCDRDAKGSALNIRMNKRKIAPDLCEVLVFGKGKTW